MAKNLVVVESPGKIKAIKSYLGSDFEVIASFGHVADLPAKGINVDIKKDFKPTYAVNPDKKDVVKKIKAQAKKAKTVFLMMDSDREGSGIARHIANYLPQGTVVRRVKSNSITKTAVQQAIENATEMSVDEDMFFSYEARRILDRLCGYRTSFLTQMATGGKSAGRVQSVALRILAEREKEIKNFVPQEYWEMTASLLSPAKEPFSATLDKKVKVKNETQAREIYEKVRKGTPVVKSIESKIVQIKPYPPFITQSMISAAKTNFGWSNDKTMKTAQDLYEGCGKGNGYITYHRSDSYTIDGGTLTAIRDHIFTTLGNSYLPEKPNFYKNKKSAQAAHTGILPTNVFTNTVESGDHQKLYEMIWKRTLASQSVPSEEKRVKVIVDIAKYDFIANGSLVLFDGWKKIYDYIHSEDVLLPDLKKKDVCQWAL